MHTLQTSTDVVNIHMSHIYTVPLGHWRDGETLMGLVSRPVCMKLGLEREVQAGYGGRTLNSK